MTINNFDKITPLLDTSNPDIFYIVQILQRKSENPLITSKGKQLKTLHVNSERTLDEEKVITLCDNLNARAYININPVSYKAAALGLIKKTLELYENGNSSKVPHIYDSVCAKLPSSSKTWLFDIDIPEDAELVWLTVPEDKRVALIPTVKGAHALTKPFDCRALRNIFTEVELHKNNPTLLYVGSEGVCDE